VVNRSFLGRQALVCLIMLAGFARLPASESDLIISVKGFSSSVPAVGFLVTELMITGLAESPILRVIEEESGREGNEGRGGALIQADYRLEGSVSIEPSGLSVAYRLLEYSNGKVLQAGTASLLAQTFEQDAASLADSLGNALMSIYAGSTIASIEELLKSQRWDEAGRRLESFESRNPLHPKLKEYQDRIARGKSAYWQNKGDEELAAAKKSKGLEALALAEQARASYEASLLLIPGGQADQQLRDSITRMLAGPVTEAAERGFVEARRALGQEAKASMRKGKPLDALLLIEDFTSLYGEGALGEELLATRARAELARGRELAGLARLALRRGELLAAESYSSQALRLAPLDKSVQALADDLGHALALAKAQEAISDLTRFDSSVEYYGTWLLSAGLTLLSYEAADFSLPLQGTVPGVELGGAWLLSSQAGLRAALRASVALAGASESAIQVWGYQGLMDQTLVLAELGAELGHLIKLPGDRAIVPAFALDLGAFYAHWDASYPGAPDADGSGWLLAPAARLSLQADIFLTASLTARASISGQSAWAFGFGPINGVRLTVSARQALGR
jgi:hypothetical protein